MYCKKCGAELSDEAAFCKKCGTKVEGSLPPEHEEPRAAGEAMHDFGATVTGMAGSAADNFQQTVKQDGGVIDILKRFFKAPIETLEYANETGRASVFWILAGVYALLAGLFALIQLAHYSSQFSFMGYSAFDGGDYAGAFFGALIGVFLVLLVLLFLLYGLGRALGGQGALKNWMAVFGTASIIALCGSVLSDILGLLSTTLSLIVSASCSLVTVVLYYEGFRIHSKLPETKRFYAYFLFWAVMSILVVLILRSYLHSVLGDLGGIFDLF